MYKFIAILSCLAAIGSAMPAVDLTQSVAAPDIQDSPALLLVQVDDDGEDLVGAETAHHGGGGFGGYRGGYGGGYGGFGGGGFGGGHGGFGGGHGGFGGGHGGYGGGFGGGYGHGGFGHGHNHYHG